MKKITRGNIRPEGGIHGETHRSVVPRNTLTGEELFWADHVLVRKKCLTEDECNKLMTLMLQTPFSEIDPKSYENGAAIEPLDKSILDRGETWKYAHDDGKDYLNINYDTPEFNFALEVVNDTLPEDEQYGDVNFVQIIKYNTDTMFHWHKDVADENDSATTIFTLNSDFEGGDFHLDQDKYILREGDMIAFNNSTERWHNVTPITKGERFCLAIWFGLRGFEDEEDEQSNSEVQSVSEGTSDT